MIRCIILIFIGLNHTIFLQLLDLVYVNLSDLDNKDIFKINSYIYNFVEHFLLALTREGIILK